jgi:cytoplasmic tRNA 2-thiolation protein 2
MLPVVIQLLIQIHRNCYAQFVTTKCVKQVGVLGKDIRAPGPQSLRRYLVGISLGTSSSVLLHLLSEYTESLLSRGRRETFQLSAVYVDTTLPVDSTHPESVQISQTLDRYAQRYPRFKIERIPLTAAIGLRSIDWSALPPLRADAAPAEQLRDLFERLPSTTSRADILRLFIRHILISTALNLSCQAVLLGHSTTALAELTLAETAKGRGFSLPWQINDGTFPVHDHATSNGTEPPATDPMGSEQSIRLHYPLREVFRKELVTYTTLTDPPLTDIIPKELEKANSVVSHKDLSIEEVMSRYFAGVEENYPSVVANVVRTTAKLNRQQAAERCGVCGMPLDETGDERWRGEIGDDGEGGFHSSPNSRLCYGCQRSVHNYT